MTIQINGRRLLITGLAILMIAVACYVAFLVGQTTRITEADATTRTKTEVTRAVDRTVKAEVKKADVRVVETKQADRKQLDKRVHRLNNMWRDRLRRAKDEARSAGEQVGYQSGQSAGYSSGHSEGVEEGIEEASDELVCSDDLDVDLPPCF